MTRKKTAKVKTTSYPLLTLSKVALTGICGAILVYVFLVISTTVSIAERKNARNLITEKKSLLAEMEMEYLDKSSSLTLDYAKSLGFSEAPVQYFAKKSSAHDSSLALLDK